jgi:hypothetical protein
MSNSSINGEYLYYAFSSGKDAVSEKRNHLNKINVFPVADGDTGTNLVLTMRFIVNGSQADSSVEKVSYDMANAALIGSHGNSGIIFAQFVRGFYNGSKNKSELSKKDFADSVRLGVDSAYRSVSHPVEGTILTIMKTWADSLASLHEKTTSFTDFIQRSIESIKKELLESPKKLKILADAGVVDAGAEGFVYFVEGFLDFLKSDVKPSTSLNEKEIIIEAETHHFDSYKTLEFRYCTEGLIQLQNLEAACLKDMISPLGDSIIIAASSDKVKFHIHTNDPAAIFTLLSKYYSIMNAKVDDMQRQTEDQFKPRSSVALVVDSACDLPKSILDKYQIHLIPINLLLGENHFLDKITITPGQFYNYIGEHKLTPITSQPSVKAFENLYESLLDNYKEIISIHLSNALSGTWNAAKLAAEKFSKDKITVINSKHISSSLGLIVQRVAEEIDKGKPLNELVEFSETLLSKTRILVGVKTLKYMIRSGRINPVKGILAKYFNLKPIISLDENGASKLAGKSFGFRNNVNNIIKELIRYNNQHPIYSYAIGHAHNEVEAIAAAEAIKNATGKKAEFIIDIAPVIGVHAGIGSVSVAFIEK